jgi:hypothetical protein
MKARNLAMLAAMCVGCASGSLFHSGPRPPELVGTWVDSAASTPADTLAWVLGGDGDYRTLTIRARSDNRERSASKAEERHYAQWYLSGSLADTLRREFCFKRRARDGGSCMRFRLDTLADGRRRLRMIGYADQAHPRERVLTERLARR